MEPQLPVLSLARGTSLIWMVSTMVYSVRLCTSCDLHEPKELNLVSQSLCAFCSNQGRRDRSLPETIRHSKANQTTLRKS